MSAEAASVCDEPKLQHNLTGHRSNVTSLEFNPAKKEQFASSSNDRTVVLWNVKRDVRSFKFSGHGDAVLAVTFSPSGHLLASASEDRTLRLWKPTIKGESFEIRAHSAAVRSVAFSPDGKYVITGSNDKSIKLWDVGKFSFVTSYTGHTNWVRCVRFVKDGKLAVSCADDKTVKTWDTQSGQCVAVYTTVNGSGNCVDVHSNGHSLAVALSSGSVRIYDIRCNKLLQHYILHDNATSLSWHPSSGYLLTSGKDKNIRVVDVLEGKPIYTLTGHEAEVKCVRFDKSGEYFASGSADKCIFVWKSNFKSA